MEREHLGGRQKGKQKTTAFYTMRDGKVDDNVIWFHNTQIKTVLFNKSEAKPNPITILSQSFL